MTILVGILVPASAPLVATLMFGSLLKESGVVAQLASTASNELANLSTIFLGLTVGSLMQADTFLQTQTLFILGLGLFAFALDTIAGILFGKMLCAVTRGKVNPLVGAAGISAFPMSGRLVQRVAQEEDFTQPRPDARHGRQHRGPARLRHRRRRSADARRDVRLAARVKPRVAPRPARTPAATGRPCDKA